MNKFNLEERLINFSVNIIHLNSNVTNVYAKTHLQNQIIRSATSSALNYGEAQSAESRKDFIHKTGICLKELRETLVCLKIMEKANLLEKANSLHQLKKENDELISIFVKSIQTSKSKLEKI